jgi:hypothetical protein
LEDASAPEAPLNSRALTEAATAGAATTYARSKAAARGE